VLHSGRLRTALPASFIPGLKCLTVTNTLAYYDRARLYKQEEENGGKGCQINLNINHYSNFQLRFYLRLKLTNFKILLKVLGHLTNVPFHRITRKLCSVREKKS